MNTLYQSFTIKKRVYEYLCWLTKEVFNISDYTVPSDKMTDTCGIRKGLEETICPNYGALSRQLPEAG
jgi:hypothetical protein